MLVEICSKSDLVRFKCRYLTLLNLASWHLETIRHFHVSHNGPYFAPKILHKHSFQFLLGRV